MNAAQRRPGLRRSILQAASTSVSSLSASSARNRYHGSIASISPISVQGSTLVANTPDSQSALNTTPDQPTAVPEEEHAMFSATQEPTGHPSISSISTIREIRTDPCSPPLVLQYMPITDVDATDHNNLTSFPQESSTSGAHHAETISPRPDIHPFTEPASSAPFHLDTEASASSSSPNNPPSVTCVGLASPCKAAKGVMKDTREIENQDVLLSNVILPTAVPQTQFLPEPREFLDRASSTSSNRPPEGVTAATTDAVSSGTSAAETSQSCVSSGSDPQEQQQTLSLRDGRLRTREESPTEGEADHTERSTEVEEVWPDRGPTTGGVPLMIIGNNFPSGRLYVRFGDSITCAVSEALRWLEG